MVAIKDITAILSVENDPQAASKSLVATANRAGGHDNITTLVIDWFGSG